MPDYDFYVQRSTDPADQVPGVKCQTATCSGHFQAPNAAAAWRIVERWCVVPGVWRAHLLSDGRALPERRITLPAKAANER